MEMADNSGVESGGDRTLRTGPPYPAVEKTDDVGPHNAVARGTLQTDGAATVCRLEFGTSTAYGSSVPCTTSFPQQGISQAEMYGFLESLSAGTAYHFRFAVESPFGVSYSQNSTFTTLNPPEFGRCPKEGQIGRQWGSFTSVHCTTSGSSNPYTWLPGAAKAGFTVKLASGTFVWEALHSSSNVVCQHELAAGHYTSARAVGPVALAMTGCTMGTKSCTSAGAGTGEILTSQLTGEPGVEKLGSQASTDKLAVDFHSDSGPVAEVACEGTTVVIRGSVIAPIKADAMLVSEALAFKSSKGKQKPERLVGGEKNILEESIGGGAYAQASIKAATTLTNEEALEANSVV
jgi:hypothetical protein